MGPIAPADQDLQRKGFNLPNGLRFFFFTHPCHDPILAFIGWKWTPKGVRFLIKKATKKTTTRHEHPDGNLPKKSYAWKRACLQAGCYYRKLFYLLRQNYRISWSPLLHYFTFAFLVKGSREKNFFVFLLVFVLLKRHWMSPRSKTGINLGCLKIYFYRVS